MGGSITNAELKVMIDGLKEYSKENKGLLEQISKDIHIVGSKVSLHEHRINKLEEERSNTKLDIRFWSMAFIAFASMVSNIYNIMAHS